LVDAVREQDTVARLGGDEFAVLLESVEDEAETDAVAQRIVEMADEPISVGTSHLSVAMSVGIAMTDGGVSTAEEAMRNADLALYEAKSLGKNQHAVFAPAMHEQAVDRLQLMAELRHGLDNDRLLVHFQPIVDMQDGHQVGVEALARWRHPTRGMIGPEQFIPLAEETGLIVPLGRTVMRQALETVAGWHAQVPGCETIGISVNLSVRQLVHPEVVADVRRALDDSGIDPRTVVLEITESVLHPGEGVTLDRLHELTSLGVRLFIDDFGTGYSSLNYLQQLPVSGIKLAREFVSTLGSTSSAAAEMTESAGGLVSTIRVLAETLGLEAIIAEGVETPEQRDALVDLGYRLGQGFLMARPMSGPAMRTHLEGRAASVLGLTVG
jgi:predicted signal transduction protein with EAL and GGDEF domain